MPDDLDTPSGPFEGPEKLLEIWFASSPADLPDATAAAGGNVGLRKVPRQAWEEMLDIVKCKVLSIVEGTEMDAYLLRSESCCYVVDSTFLRDIYRTSISTFVSKIDSAAR